MSIVQELVKLANTPSFNVNRESAFNESINMCSDDYFKMNSDSLKRRISTTGLFPNEGAVTFISKEI